MASLSRRARLCAFFAIGLAVLLPGLPGPSARAASMGPPAPQTRSSADGQTTMRLPSQVLSGSRLPIVVRTVPDSSLTLTITFADNSQIVLHRRVPASGAVLMAPLITYQPQGSSETATVTVQVVGTVVGAGRGKPGRRIGRQLPPTPSPPGSSGGSGGFSDTVQGTITVLQHIQLNGRLLVPRSVVAGGQLAVTVITNVPNVSVRFLLTYPDKQTESPAVTGATDATRIYRASLPVSASDGVHGILRVQAILSYAGVERRVPLIPARVILRAPAAAPGGHGHKK